MPAHTIELQAEPRAEFGKHVKRLRRVGVVPANLFGHGTSTAFQAPARTLEHLLAHGGRTSIVNINIGAGGEAHTALLKHYTRDAKSGQLLHLDFQAVRMNETVSTSVPVHFVGEAPAVKTGGVLVHNLTDLKIEAEVRNLPQSIEVDLSGLAALHDTIKVGDLTAPSGVTLLDPADEVLVVILPPTVEPEPEPEAAEEAAAAEAEGAEGEAAVDSAEAGESEGRESA